MGASPDAPCRRLASLAPDTSTTNSANRTMSGTAVDQWCPQVGAFWIPVPQTQGDGT